MIDTIAEGSRFRHNGEVCVFAVRDLRTGLLTYPAPVAQFIIQTHTSSVSVRISAHAGKLFSPPLGNHEWLDNSADVRVSPVKKSNSHSQHKPQGRHKLGRHPSKGALSVTPHPIQRLADILQLLAHSELEDSRRLD